MGKRVVRTRMTQKEVQRLAVDLPGILSGEKKSKFRLHAIFWGAVANSLFESIFDNFLVKSMGEADDQGTVWDDLSPYTKAYKRKIKKSEMTARQRRRYNSSTRGLLSPGEQARWSKIFGIVFGRNRWRIGNEEAKKLAGRVAWAILKKEGAETLLSAFGDRKIPIMIDSAKLIHSVEPGQFDPGWGYRRKNRNQVYLLGRGKIEVGSNLSYADAATKRRPMWQEDMGSWMDRAMEAGMEAVEKRIAEVTQR